MIADAGASIGNAPASPVRRCSDGTGGEGGPARRAATKGGSRPPRGAPMGGPDLSSGRPQPAQGFDSRSALPLSMSTGTETCSWTISQRPPALRQTSDTRTTSWVAAPSLVVQLMSCTEWP